MSGELERLPSPKELGMPGKYVEWRPFQEQAIRSIDAATGTICSMLPPGAGKSGIYMGWAAWKNKRICVLVPSKYLQKQLYEDFKGFGLVSLEGQANPKYHCEITEGSVATAPCHGGFDCELKRAGCKYFADLRRAAKEQYVLTNYAFWMHNKNALGEFDALVMDETHQAFNWIANHVSVSFTRREVDENFHRHPVSDWKPWAEFQARVFAGEVKELKAGPKSNAMYERVRVLRRWQEEVSFLARADPKSLVFEKKATGWRWECVWPGNYRGLLISNAKKYIMTSGTMTKRTVAMLGYSKAEYEWHAYPSTFPVERRPVHILPAPRMNASISPGGMKTWLNCIDRYADTRSKWRGVVHSGSYARSEYIAVNSRHKDRVIVHMNSAGLAEAIERFLATPGSILVSPSIMEGVDFPYEKCDWNYIAKIPFGNHNEPVLAERLRQDPEFGIYSAAFSIVQAAFRGMRAIDDYCETAIGDGSWQHWFFRRAKHHFPQYFLDAVVPCDGVPAANEKLRNKLKKVA